MLRDLNCIISSYNDCAIKHQHKEETRKLVSLNTVEWSFNTNLINALF